MNIAKVLLILSSLLGVANAYCSSPTAIYCVAESPGPQEVKLVQTYDDTVKVVLSLTCEGDGVAYACMDEDAPDGLVGAIISADDEQPMCMAMYYVYGQAKRYTTVCKGYGFKITQNVRIRYLGD